MTANDAAQRLRTTAVFGAELEIEMEITTARHGHGYEAGDMLKITTMDNRRWKRFLHWITFRRPPTITTFTTIASASTATLTTGGNMTQKYPNINCTMYSKGRCLHQAAPRRLFGATCVLCEPLADPRRYPGCTLQVQHQRPPPPGVPYVLEDETKTQAMGKQAWISRCAAQFIKHGGLSADDATTLAETCLKFADGDLTKEPEDVAAEEMSKWEGSPYFFVASDD